MKLKNAQIQGFRSFVAFASVDFGDPGLVFVAGKNLVEPSLGANGAGKSSLFEAVHWCLFGKTSRGLKAGAINSWTGEAKTVVSLQVEAFDQDYEVTRTWNPNRLSVCQLSSGEEHEVDQAQLEELLGVSPKTFLYSVYFAQFSPSFLDLKPTEQMTLFSEVLKLDLWEEASIVAGKQARAGETLLQSLELKISGLQGELKASEAYLEAEEAKRLEQVRSRYHAGISLKQGLLKAREDLVRLEAMQKTAGEGQAKARRELRNSITEIEENKDLAIRQQAEWQATLRGLVRLVEPSKTCPTCGGPLDSKQVAKAMKEFRAAQAQIKELESHLKKVAEWLDDWYVELRDLNSALDELVEDGGLARDLATAKQVLAMFRSDLDRLLKEPLPKEDPEVLSRCASLREELQELRGAADEERKHVQALQYWQKEFKELRLFLIEESLTQLEVEVNSALHELGLEEWRVEFDVEREKKTGEIKTGFSVLIYSPINEQLVPWEAWSGGESQRLRLAAAMGFASLVSAMSGAGTSTEFWDEPSTWLSTSGITDLMQTLKSRADNSDKQIWIADHRALDYGGFSKVVTVTKGENGSTIS